MRTAIIVCDPAGIKSRAEMLVGLGDVYCVTTTDRPHAHTHAVTIPNDWLPNDSRTLRERCWHKADTLALAAIQQLQIVADFYWVIESDVAAPRSRWEALMESTAADETDGIFAKMTTRDGKFAHFVKRFNHTTCPKWVTHSHLNPLYRLSRFAVEECARSAVEMRDCFCEQTVASVIVRAGGTVRNLHEFGEHFTNTSLMGKVGFWTMQPGLLNHPVKDDIEIPDFTATDSNSLLPKHAKLAITT